jgi:SAM-dependent methyltransferase
MNDCLLYSEPELYDLLFPNAGEKARVQDEARRERIALSEKFYLEEAEAAKGGPVLELACGTGRLTIPIAQTGVEIAGADASLSMLEKARAKAAAAGVDMEFFAADMCDFVRPERFALIFIAGNTLQHLMAADDLRRCFACARRHLAPGGRFVFDVAVPDPGQLARDSSRRYPVMQVKHPLRGVITLEEEATYDAASRIRTLVWYLSTPDTPDFRVINFRLRMLFPAEVEQALEAAGLRLDARYGEYSRVPFEASSPRQVCLCSADS